jgi:hypothetical protein
MTSSILRIRVIRSLHTVFLVPIPASRGAEAPPLQPLERARGLRIEAGGPMNRKNQ